MWSKLIGFFKKAKTEKNHPSHKEILEEKSLKKSLRKQTVFLDLFRKEVLERLEEKRVKEVRHLLNWHRPFFITTTPSKRFRIFHPITRRAFKLSGRNWRPY